MVTLLLTAFGPFPGCPVNPTERLAPRLAERVGSLTGWKVETRTLPVDWAAAATLADELAAPPARFEGILALGVAPRRARICVERCAHNEAAQKGGASGALPETQKLVPGGPTRLEGWLHRPPFGAVLPALAAEGWPVAYSDDAGRYLCNALFYRLLHRLGAPAGRAPLLGFVHIPHVRGVSADDLDPNALAPDVAEGALERLVVGYVRAAPVV